MSMRMREDQEAVVLEPATTPTASVIWLHGLGADGHDFVPIVPQLMLPPQLGVRFVFPHAPPRPVSLNQGMRMRAWYDIAQLSAAAEEDAGGIAESAARIEVLLRRERAQAIAAERIVLAGFSQGGAMALYCGLRFGETLAGILALSTYLPLRARLASEGSEANRRTPILMCHGRFDPVVGMQFAQASREALLQLGYAVQWQEYPMRHEVCAPEISDISSWLRGRLG